MKAQLQQFKAKYRYAVILLRELVRTDFKIRYQNSVLGYVWSLLKPFSLFFIMYVVFVKILNALPDTPHAGVYLLLGIIIWNYFTEVTNGSVSAIVSRGDLLRKINFPRYVIILSGSVSALINLVFNVIVLAIFMVVSKVEISSSVVFLPFLIIELFIFALAVGFILSALYVRFRDIGFVWEVVMQGAFFATPIMYQYSQITDKSMLVGKILICNPIAQLMQDARAMLITNKATTISDLFSTPWARVIPVGIVIFTLFVAATYFRGRSKLFAEEV